MASALAAVAFVWLLLVLPGHPSGLTPAGVLFLPLELPVIVLGLMLLRGPALAVGRALVAALLVAGALSRLADLAAYTAFARPFNPVLDHALVPAAVRLAAGSIGRLPTLLLALAAFAVILGALAAAYWATGRIAALRVGGRATVTALLLLALVPLGLDLSGHPLPFASARASRLAAEETTAALAARADLARFRVEAGRDPYADAPADTILQALRGHDVFIVFVESYGRTALESPLYAPTIRATLTEGEADLAAAGLAARSGWLEVPMTGGQSWFAHGSLLSGLRIDSQPRYDALMASPRLTLPRLAQRAGWRSVAVMPAITLAWPEAGYFGYDTVLAAQDLGYRGLPFNWVTMPDQFTLASFERQALDVAPRPPVVAEIALISSHAPWTPIPPLIPWEAVGDGRVFDRWATGGEPPDVLWRDPDKVRAQYRDALDYALRTILAFAARRGGSAPVLIVLGDHQPAGFVSGEIGGRDVPVHLIGPPDIVGRTARWGWTDGLLPSPDVAPWPMEAFRDRFLATFTDP